MSEITQNATYATDAIASISGESASWIITIIVILATVTLLYLVSKNFRQLIYGSVTSISLFVVYKFSRYIGTTSAIDHNPKPLNWMIKISCFILISIVIGRIIAKTKWGKTLEEQIELTKEEK